MIITGGEPALQKETLKKILISSKKEDLQTMVITNGTKPNVLLDLKNY